MKKRIAIIGALVSLLPIGQPLVLGTGTVLTSAAVMLSLPEKTLAESGDFYFDRGYEKFNQKNYYGAIIELTKAISINPNNWEPYRVRGMSKGYLNDFYGAISDFNKVIEIYPGYDRMYSMRGLMKLSVNDISGACLDFKKSIRVGFKEAIKYVDDYCR